MADYKYYPEGEQERVLHRSVCTPDTRVRILKDITDWANDTSPESQSVYWLYGPAGSGKSTIAYTIAQAFDRASSAEHESIRLGGNFFCSRQFKETRLASRIIRTIVHHLALRCTPFANTLKESGKLESINHNVQAQLEGLLVGPWLKCRDARLVDASALSHYLVVIDALDEIEGTGGSEFLRDLFNTLEKHRLPGLKFLATSRYDADLVNHVDQFDEKQQYRLEEVPVTEITQDITTYLTTS